MCVQVPCVYILRSASAVTACNNYQDGFDPKFAFTISMWSKPSHINPLMPLATFFGRFCWNLQGMLIKDKFEFHFFIFSRRPQGKKWFFSCIKYLLGTYSFHRAVVYVLTGSYIQNRIFVYNKQDDQDMNWITFVFSYYILKHIVTIMFPKQEKNSM